MVKYLLVLQMNIRSEAERRAITSPAAGFDEGRVIQPL